MDGISNTFNYILPIKESEDSTTEAFFLYLLDSGSLYCNGLAGFGCVEEDQVEWIKGTAISNTYGLVFTHMPVTEYLDAFNQYDYYGLKNGLVSCPSTNTGLFDAMSSMNFAQGMSVGHDVRNGFYSYVGDIFLHYGRSTSGTGLTDDMLSGARVFNI